MQLCSCTHLIRNSPTLPAGAQGLPSWVLFVPCSLPFLLSGLPPHPSPLASLTSSFICKGTFYAYMYVCEVGGGTRGEEERAVGGGGEMAKLKADAERLFFLDPGGVCWQWVSGT